MTDDPRATFEALFCEQGRTTPPPRLGIRYDASGRFLAERGNTVVRHVIPGSPTEAALARVRAGLEALPWADRFAFTPPASWHMTVFEGVIETRRQAGYWPGDMPLDAPVDDVTAHLSRRLGDLPALPAFAMAPERVTPLGLLLVGASDDDEATARGIRDFLAETFGYRSPEHDRYRFHVTLAYVKAWLPDGAAEIYVPALERLSLNFAATVPALDLGPPAFCTFEDMTAFPPVRRM